MVYGPIRYVPEGTVYTHPDARSDADRARVRHDLERFAAGTRAWWTETNPAPRKRCPTCNGTGLESHTGPHAGSCSGCRGGKWVDMTTAEIRDEYRRVRAEACERLETSPRVFDSLAGTNLPDNATPADWLRAAREIARPR